MQIFYVTRGMSMHTVKAKTQEQAERFFEISKTRKPFPVSHIATPIFPGRTGTLERVRYAFNRFTSDPEEEGFGGSFIPSQGPWKYDVEYGKTWGTLEAGPTGDILFKNRILVVKERGEFYRSCETDSHFYPVLAFVHGRIFSGSLESDCDGGLSFDGSFTENDGIELSESDAFNEALYDAKEQCRIRAERYDDYIREEQEQNEKDEAEYDEETRKQAREFLADAPECFSPVLTIPASAEVTYRHENGESFATVTAEVEITFKRAKNTEG